MRSKIYEIYPINRISELAFRTFFQRERRALECSLPRNSTSTSIENSASPQWTLCHGSKHLYRDHCSFWYYVRTCIDNIYAKTQAHKGTSSLSLLLENPELSRNAFFTVVGHQMISIQTGGFVPVLVRAIGSVSIPLWCGGIWQAKRTNNSYVPNRHPEVSMPVITGGQSATQPVCTANPTSAINSPRWRRRSIL